MSEPTADSAPSPHPGWLAVGVEVEVIRSLGRSVVGRRNQTVARHTKTLVVLDDGSRFRRVSHGFNNEDYEQTPQYLDYLDYRTWIAAPPAQNDDPGDDA